MTEPQGRENDDANESSQGGLSKKEKGRFKKLRKRMDQELTHQFASGLVSKEDCLEFDELSSKTTEPSPRVAEPRFLWRKGTPQGRRTEGSHHRDILFTLLLPPKPPVVDKANEERTTSDKNENEKDKSHGEGPAAKTSIGKKRPRQESQDRTVTKDNMLQYKSLPSWLCLHNPGCISSCSVLEIHVADSELLASTQQKIVKTLELSNRHHLVTPTRWFSGHHPKSMTEALLFASPDKPRTKTKEKDCKIQDMEGLTKKLSSMVLSPAERQKAGYPMPGQLLNGKWVTSPERGDSSTPSIFALDCEMVETTEGRALARFTLIEAIEYDLTQESVTIRVVLDTLIQPEHRITDYVTQYSGVTAALLEKGPTMSMQELHDFINSTVGADDIIIGHSLENDLVSCLWIHTNCVDTAVLFSHKSGSFKYSLRHLSNILLKRHIQQPDKPHCSEEDAKAALDLAVARALKGKAFGPSDMRSSNQWSKFCTKENGGNTVVAIGPNSWLQKYVTNPPNAAHALSCESCKDASAKASVSFLSASKNKKRKAGLVWSHFHASNEQEVESCCEILNQLVQSASRKDTVFLIALQSQNANVMNQFRRRRALRDPKTTFNWTSDDEDKFGELLEECRLGVSIWS